MPSTTADPNRHCVLHPTSDLQPHVTVLLLQLVTSVLLQLPTTLLLLVVLAGALRRPRMHCWPAPLHLFTQRRTCFKRGMTKCIQGKNKYTWFELKRMKHATFDGPARRLPHSSSVKNHKLIFLNNFSRSDMVELFETRRDDSPNLENTTKSSREPRHVRKKKKKAYNNNNNNWNHDLS